MAEPFDHFYKLLLLGDQYTGKTSLLRRFTEDKFQTSYLHTIGIDFKIRIVDVHGKKIKLQLWDTAGQESYYRGAQGIVLVYDIGDRNSFINIRNWVNDIRQHGSSTVEKILVGNKCDMVDARMVLEEEGRQLAAVIGARFIETSARNNVNVERAFLTLVSDITVRQYSGGSLTSLSSPSRKNHPNKDPQSPQRTSQQVAVATAAAAAGVDPFQVGCGNTLKIQPGSMNNGGSSSQRNSCCRFY